MKTEHRETRVQPKSNQLKSSQISKENCCYFKREKKKDKKNCAKMVVRQYEEELKYIEKINDYSYRIKKGFQPNMNVEGVFYVNKHLEQLMFEELKNSCRPGMDGGFLPGLLIAFVLCVCVVHFFSLFFSSFHSNPFLYSFSSLSFFALEILDETTELILICGSVLFPNFHSEFPFQTSSRPLANLKIY